MSACLAVESLTFRYPGHAGPLPVLEGVNLTLGAGQVLMIVGPNGTGKSTLLRCMAGLLRPERGRVRLDGEDLASVNPSRLARRLGYVSQAVASAFPFRVRDVVVMGRAPHLNTLASPSPEDVRIAAEAMREMGISHLAERSCHEISGGEWQLALLARALTQCPEVLLLDEPTAHLDLGNQMRILSHIRRLAARGLTVALASHSPDHGFLVADLVAVLADRSVMTLGTPSDVLTEALLARVYGVEVRIAEIGGEGGRRICVPILRA